MIHLEAWYREALETELQREFKTLPGGEEGLDQALRTYLRTGKLPPKVDLTDFFDHLLQSAKGRGAREDLAALWRFLWDHPDKVPGWSSHRDVSPLHRDLYELIVKTESSDLPMIPTVLNRYQRVLDYSEVSPPVDEEGGRNARFDEVLEVEDETPWELIEEVTLEIPLREVLDLYPRSGKEEGYLYYQEDPSWTKLWNQVEAIQRAGETPRILQTREEMDLNHLPGGWGYAIMLWRQWVRGQW